MPVYSIIKKSELEGALRLDAEYYRPEYLDINSKIKSKNSKFLGDLAKNVICGPFGSAILQENYQEKGVPLARVADLNDWFVGSDRLVFIDEILSQSLKRYQVIEGDVVVSQRGTIAMFSKITNKFPKWNISANLVSIKKSDKINFDYLLAFLNSSYGMSQLFRKLSGQVQPKITTDDVKQILIFVPDIGKQREVALLVTSAWQKQEESKSFYSQAEQVLLKELGLEDFEESSFAKASAGKQDDLFSIVKFSDIKKFKRMDAEYFQPKYERLTSRIKQTKHSLLGDLVSIKKGIEVGAEQYQENGKLFFRVSSLSRQGIVDKDQKYLSDELYQKLKANFEPKAGEILLTKDATPGIAYVLKEKVEGVISSGILRLKLKQEIEAEYLALFINSILGQMQAERDAGGSIISHWKPEQVKNLIVPILPQKTQQKITELVIKSHQAREKGKELLAQAKQKVENLIESS